MNDITATVLTIGEQTTEQAIESIKDQTVPPVDIVIISNISPFHKAFNLAASKVKTELFIQIDSDTIIDKDCLEVLRKCMTEKVGLVIAHCRDPLIGRTVSGLRMFRTKCFKNTQFADSISPDTDFVCEILKHGWKTVYALKFNGDSKESWHTFGAHVPDYNPLYTYHKYLLLGRRYRYRKDRTGLLWHLKQLQKNSTTASLIGLIAISHGIFLKENKDLLKPYIRTEDFNFLEKFLKSDRQQNINKFEVLPYFIFRSDTAFKKYFRLGVYLRKSGSFTAFKYCMDILNQNTDALSWLGKIALCHGLFFSEFDEDIIKKDYILFKELLYNYKFNLIVKKKLKMLYLSGFKDILLFLSYKFKYKIKFNQFN